VKHVKAALIIILILFLALLPTNATAHPGRTDAEGGHRDSSTGEYHYHTGASSQSDADSASQHNSTVIGITTVFYCLIAVSGSGVVIIIGVKTVKKKRPVR